MLTGSQPIVYNIAMAICSTCQQEIHYKELLKHRWVKHREEMMAQSNRAREKSIQAKAEKAGKSDGNYSEAGTAATESGRPGLAKGTISKLTLVDHPVDAIVLQFLSQTQYPVPNTPGIMIPYVLAVQSGFPGSFGDWLGIVSTQFWYDRGVDPFKEVHYGAGAGQGDEELVQQSAAEQPL